MAKHSVGALQASFQIIYVIAYFAEDFYIEKQKTVAFYDMKKKE